VVVQKSRHLSSSVKKPETMSTEIQITTNTPDDDNEKSANKKETTAHKEKIVIKIGSFLKKTLGRAVNRVGEFLYLFCLLVICSIAFIPFSLPFYMHAMVVDSRYRLSLAGPVVKNKITADNIPSAEDKTFGSKLKSIIKKATKVVGSEVYGFAKNVVEVAPIIFFLPILLVSKDCI